MVFTPDQLISILTNASTRDALQNYLDGNPGSGSSAATLDLSNTDWNAKVSGFEVAKLALKSGEDFVLTSIVNDLPNYNGETGTPGDNTLVATSATVLSGLGGNDILVAKNTGTTLDGGDGHDLLLGRDGADRLFGGKGNDILVGGKGPDTFVFTAATTGAADHDVVVDFKHGEDVIEFSTALFANFGELLKNAHASADGQDTLIKFGNHDFITLKNTPLSLLSPQDFHFVTLVGDMLVA
jgi:Ca2+-binding RTX toxin-like protein